MRKDGTAEAVCLRSTRSTPLLPAGVGVSPDAVIDPGKPSCTSQVEVQTDELTKHPELRLQAGMPAEVRDYASAHLAECLLEPLETLLAAHRANPNTGDIRKNDHSVFQSSAATLTLHGLALPKTAVKQAATRLMGALVHHYTTLWRL